MSDEEHTVNRVHITPIRRLRVLTNQRMSGFIKAKLITPEFISDMLSTYEKQSQSIMRTMILASIYLALMYIAYSGGGVKIAIFGIDFSDIPKLLEITIALFSFSMFYIGVQNLNLTILLQYIDSMVGAVIPDDELSQSLIKSRYATLTNFFLPFQTSMKFGDESIQPVGITRIFNVVNVVISLFTILAVYIIPIVFMLVFAIPSLTTSLASISIGILAWSCSFFLIATFLCQLLKLPYDETLCEAPIDDNVELE